MEEMRSHDLVELYLHAKDCVVGLGYADEIDWQSSMLFEELDESTFLRELAWVVMNSGMKEAVVRGRFDQVSRAFRLWKCAQRISDNREQCEVEALRAFRHAGKIGAIASAAERVSSEGFGQIKQAIATGGVQYLSSFEYIGPITSHHLAKNIGLETAKPDRHLQRIAKSTGFQSAGQLCRLVAELTGDRVSVIDLVLWRFATLRPDYVALCSRLNHRGDTAWSRMATVWLPFHDG